MNIECKARINSSQSEEYKSQLDDYNEHLEMCERVDIEATMPRPIKSISYDWKKCILYVNHLQEQLTHYIEEAESANTLTLVFIDGTSMIIEKNDKIIKQLNSL